MTTRKEFIANTAARILAGTPEAGYDWSDSEDGESSTLELLDPLDADAIVGDARILADALERAGEAPWKVDEAEIARLLALMRPFDPPTD